MSENTNRNNWVFALIASIAVNGLLGGLLLAKGMGPKQDGQHTPPPVKIAAVNTGPNNPRRILRSLPPARRKQVLRAAMKQIKYTGGEHPRALMQKLRNARQSTLQAATANPLDEAALKLAQEEVRKLQQDLAVQSDALIVEVLKQLSPDEKQKALESLKAERRRAPNNRRQRD